MLAPRAEVVPLGGSASPAPSFPKLNVPLRSQPSTGLGADVSCGVQALGMALSGLAGSSAPTSTALLGFLQGNGMMYDFGTGVEELAYAAQAFGYRGATSFYEGDLALLQSELEAGRPVVVSLGSNGEGLPGHFVTVTGISPDGRYLSYNDPTLGQVTVSTEEFLRL
jgi:predicted double-glycine peptidase